MYSIGYATPEPAQGPELGWLVNHGSKGEVNAKMCVKTLNSFPFLCLYDTERIEMDQEILYDYGIEEHQVPYG